MRRASAALQLNFNPRSLTGATADDAIVVNDCLISIHAPLRERQFFFMNSHFFIIISIHAPLRERRYFMLASISSAVFQSTLPCGSDSIVRKTKILIVNFNPRSLAGATSNAVSLFVGSTISIHAPLRERRLKKLRKYITRYYFNPRSLAGATGSAGSYQFRQQHFNPRSLAGATASKENTSLFI